MLQPSTSSPPFWFEMCVHREGSGAPFFGIDDGAQTHFRFCRSEGVLIHVLGDTSCRGIATGNCLNPCNQVIHVLHIGIKRTGTLRGCYKISLDFLEGITCLDDEGTFFVQMAFADRFPYYRYDQGQAENYRPRDTNCDSGKALFSGVQG